MYEASKEFTVMQCAVDYRVRIQPNEKNYT